ncbi:hypothetical protein [Demequina pelophila]|uniref:hypothetical protein n=1 Tax=Demequina pelophila TaxID=1638984 RepID=UPI000783E078|nr:hypothetical protein [Demequina pelophila]
MPLPVVVAAVAIGVSAVVGGGAAIDGGIKMKSAKDTVRTAQRTHEARLTIFRAEEARVQAVAGAYGKRQLRIQKATLGGWVEWLEANEKKVRLIGRPTVDGVEVEQPDIPHLKARVVESVTLLKGGMGAAAGAVAMQQGALWGVTSFAAASTGTAISGLSGAAAQSATLAWLGGGSIAAGGGGVALGGLMLTGIAAAPAALIGGFAVGVQGQKAKTKAKEIEANVEVAVAEMEAKQALLRQVEVRIGELEDVLDRMNARALASLEALAGLDFDPEAHLADFQRTALLMAALGKILGTPVVDVDGRPSQESLKIKLKYAA